jgi:hypothetical protein
VLRELVVQSEGVFRRGHGRDHAKARPPDAADVEQLARKLARRIESRVRD